MNTRIFIVLFLFTFCASGQFLIDPYRYVSAATPIYNEQDAADPNNESNTVGANWSPETANIDITSSTGQVDNGTYSLNIDCNTTAALESAQLTLVNVDNGDNITISGRIYENQGNWSVRAETANGWTTAENASGFTDATWVDFSVTATANQDDPIINFRAPSNAVAGFDIFIDNIVITVN